MANEIERKFLVNGEFKSQAISSSKITQGYICSDPSRTVRIRIRDRKAYLTIKGKSDESGLSRYEWEKEISVLEANELLKLCKPGIIEKNRYLVRSGNHTFEIDEFYGENQGLILAEVELNAIDEPYIKPDFIGEEVTGDIRYYNSQLRNNPFTKW